MADITLENFLGSTDGVVQQILTQTYPALASAVSTPIYYLSVIYVAWAGYQVYAGHAPLNGLIVLKKVALISLVMLALNWGATANTIYGFFTSFAEGAGSTIMAGQPTATMFDAIQTNVTTLLVNTLQKSPWNAFAIIAITVFALLVNEAELVVAMANLVLAKVGLAITMLLLPLFLCFLFFDFTRQWFANWINMMLNFCLIYIITIAVLRFGFLLFANAITEIQNSANATDATIHTIKQAVSIAVMQGILVVFLFQVRSLAASLSNSAVTQGHRALEIRMEGRHA